MDIFLIMWHGVKLTLSLQINRNVVVKELQRTAMYLRYEAYILEVISR